MTRKTEYSDFLQDILESTRNIKEFVRGMDLEDFKEDTKTVYATIRAIEIIGEAAKRIPTRITAKYQEIPWKDMAGMRDKLIHQYSGVDLEVLWKTIEKDIPMLEGLISKVLTDASTEEMKESKKR